MLTDITPNENDTLEKGVLISEEDNQSPDKLKALMVSFLSSEQISKGEENYPIVPTTSRVKILIFEDTLSKDDSR